MERSITATKIRLDRDIFLWNKAMQIYSASFPEWEKEPIAEIYEKIKEGKQIMYVLQEEDAPIAIVILDVSKEGNYVLFAYLAVRADKRLSGFGSGLCSEVVRIFREDKESKYLFVESEKDLYYFYEQAGFERVPINYLSPSFTDTEKSIPMGLFTLKGEANNIPREELKRIIRDIYEKSYNLKNGDKRFADIEKI
jgi:N-acetylglutamate synthase-like GNAT family acetyltransferase